MLAHESPPAERSSSTQSARWERIKSRRTDDGPRFRVNTVVSDRPSHQSEFGL